MSDLTELTDERVTDLIKLVASRPDLERVSISAPRDEFLAVLRLAAVAKGIDPFPDEEE